MKFIIGLSLLYRRYKVIKTVINRGALINRASSRCEDRYLIKEQSELINEETGAKIYDRKVRL